MTSRKCDFPENIISQEMWQPGNFDFLGNATSREMWLPGKYDFPGYVTSRETWLPMKFDILGNVTSCKILLYWEWLPEKFDDPGNVTNEKYDLSGNVTSWEKRLLEKYPGKVAFQTMWTTWNSDFCGKNYKYGIMLIFGDMDMHTGKTCDKFDHGSICDKAQY